MFWLREKYPLKYSVLEVNLLRFKFMEVSCSKYKYVEVNLVCVVLKVREWHTVCLGLGTMAHPGKNLVPFVTS